MIARSWFLTSSNTSFSLFLATKSISPSRSPFLLKKFAAQNLVALFFVLPLRKLLAQAVRVFLVFEVLILKKN